MNKYQFKTFYALIQASKQNDGTTGWLIGVFTSETKLERYKARYVLKQARMMYNRTGLTDDQMVAKYLTSITFITKPTKINAEVNGLDDMAFSTDINQYGRNKY